MFGNTSFGNTSFGGSTFGTSFGAQPSLGAFGSSTQAPTQSAGPVGTTIPFNALTGTDSVPKTGTNAGGPSQITTRHQNISAMKEYESKSNEELRFEDYTANRKVGQPRNAFGSTPFNSIQPSTSQQSTSIFGTPSQQTPTLFGTPTQNQNQNIFGQPKTGFDMNSSSNIFGSNLNKPNTTVSNSPFSIGNQFNTSASTAGGQTGFPLSFTANNQASSTAFGTSSTVNSPFKPNMFAGTQTNTGSLFNTTSTSGTSAFGINTSQTNNQTQPQTPFGTNNSIFGSPANNTNAFGSANLFNSQQKNGFELNSGSTGGIFNTLNKPATTTASQSPFQIGTSFGASTSNAGGLSIFNNTSQPSTTMFGTPSLSTPNKTVFGPATTTTTSIFGTNTTATNTTNFLGQTPNLTTQTQTPFGQPGNSSIFGTNTNQNSTSTLFNPAPTSTAQPFTFPTSNTQQTSSLFNNSLNTDANKPVFSLPTGNSMFNFGTSSIGNTLTQNTSTTTASLFGNTTTSTPSNPFSSSNNNNNLSFGAQNTSNSLFGFSTQNTQTNPLQQQNPSSANSQQNPQNSELLLNRLKTLPYGETSLFLCEGATSPGLGSLKFTTDPKTINQYKMSAKTNVKLNKPTSTEKPRANSVLFDGLDDNTNDDLRCAIDVFVPKKNIKKLDLKPSSHMSEGDADRASDSPAFERSRTSLNSRSLRENTIDNGSPSIDRHVRYADGTFPGDRSEVDQPSFISHIPNLSPSSDVSSLHSGSRSNTSIHSNLNASTLSSRSYTGSRCGLTNTRPDYKIKPSIDEMEMRYNSETDACIVNSLTIDRPNYGSILFDSPLDVKGLNLDEIVHIRRKEVIVYPDDENKPPVGQGLNRPAVVTLHQVWPIDKSTNEVIKDTDRLNRMRYPEKIEAATHEKGARFIEYRAETGSWVFAVKHFSKYGITDDDEETDQNAVNGVLRLVQPLQQQTTPIQRLSQTAQSLPPMHQQTQTHPIPHNRELLLDRLKVSPLSESLMSLNNSRQSARNNMNSITMKSAQEPAPLYKMSPKTSVRLAKSIPLDKSKTESVSSDGMDDLPNYSQRSRIDGFFDDDDEQDGRKGDVKRSLTVHGTKRLALQNMSPNVSASSYDKPITVGAIVPQQQRIREIKLRPDLFAAQNKLSRDVMSVCASGSPKVRFYNGSRRFCWINGNNVIVSELKLVPTTNLGTLEEELSSKFEVYLERYSMITSPSMNPVLAPYIETEDFIPEASSHDLLHALYGRLNSKTPYAKQDERLSRVINWLASVNKDLPPPTNLYQQIVYHMSCDRYDLASDTAMDNNHPRLALLVATLNLNKDLMFEQLSSWRLSTADQYIDPELLKIYVLLSGLTEWKLSNDVTVYCLKGLKWTQQVCLLALHVTTFVTEPDKFGFHMLPLYIKRLDTDTNDVDYHILARHNPANILSAAHSLVEEWFLLESLKSFHVINSESECVDSDIVHCNLASQLAPIDLRWACFVALHIISNEVRNQVLIKCLEQNHTQFKDEKLDKSTATMMSVESWLVDKLKVPKEFIDNSKNRAGLADAGL